MNIFGKISLILWLITLAAFAIMFDWFDSREIATTGLEFLQGAIEKLEDTGDQMQDVVDVVSEDSELFDESKEVVKEAVE